MGLAGAAGGVKALSLARMPRISAKGQARKFSKMAISILVNILTIAVRDLVRCYIVQKTILTSESGAIIYHTAMAELCLEMGPYGTGNGIRASNRV